ncbi:AAA family ATPase [Clostridium paridis]|uniref:AAA family ATPase n=1 Tax=Clostridium paridis TaxID=2803863 RepID=A0A937FJ91_9CLOT|nr:AAA family ATPase [Clostridium paridis]
MRGESYIEINIKNCNNIKEGLIKIEQDKLNIKYAMNGTGKSTLSKAIRIKSEQRNLDELTPFSKEGVPFVKLSREINKVLMFDDEFVNNIVFNENEVIKNSFDVFIKTEDYDIRRKQLNDMLRDLKMQVVENDKIEEMINVFFEVSKKIVQNNDGRLKSNPFLKAITRKENLHNIPQRLEKYKIFIQNDNYNIEWIDWKNRGFNFDERHICPFCSEKLQNDYNEEKEVFTKSYDKNNTRHIKDMLNYFKDMEKYINKDKYEVLESSLRTVEDDASLKLELETFIKELNYIKNKIIEIREFDSYKIKNEEISKLDEKVKKFEINKSILNIFNSEYSLEIVDSINEKVKNLIEKITILKSDVGKLNGYIQAVIKNSKQDIDAFLESAGINYEIVILVKDEGDATTILKYKGKDNISYEVENIKKHLSWGEKNAFALILFMYYSLRQEAELIILDDPISSFDSNKKYAIINRLFKKTNGNNNLSLYNKTVLMLTHDFEPVIDFIINHKPTGGFVSASYLKNNLGMLYETEIIDNSDIQPVMSMLINNARNRELNYVHRVISFRKYIEYMNFGDTQSSAYDILSSLIHGKKIPDRKIGIDQYKSFTEDELSNGLSYIYKFIEDFDYESILKTDYSQKMLVHHYTTEENNYLKLQIFRQYLEISDIRDKINDDVVLKFVDNVYHIENDYTYCLNFMKYDIVPTYIIKRIDDFMELEVVKVSKES